MCNMRDRVGLYGVYVENPVELQICCTSQPFIPSSLIQSPLSERTPALQSGKCI
jgi:hypothetical protein